MRRMVIWVVMMLGLASAGCKNFDNEMFHLQQSSDVPVSGYTPPNGKSW